MKNGEWRVANGESAMRARSTAQRKPAPSAIRHPPSAIGSALLAAVLAAACNDEPVTAVPGDPKAGRAALERYQCGACHAIPGIAGARGLVGPPLTEYGQRVYIAGKFPKEPALLAKWIQDAPALAPQTAMPNVGVTEADARDIAAYLLQLR